MISEDRIKQLLSILRYNTIEDRTKEKIKREYYRGYMQCLTDVYGLIIEEKGDTVNGKLD